MAIQQAVAGAYVPTYNSVATGFNTLDGVELETQTAAEEINETDYLGKSMIDFVHQGMSTYITFTSKIYQPGSITPYYPWGNLGVIATAANPIARLASNVAMALLLTATAATPAVGALPAVNAITASKAILPPGSNLKLIFSSKVRNVPIRLVCLPSEQSGNVTTFSTTAHLWLAGLAGMALSALAGLSGLA